MSYGEALQLRLVLNLLILLNIERSVIEEIILGLHMCPSSIGVSDGKIQTTPPVCCRTGYSIYPKECPGGKRAKCAFLQQNTKHSLQADSTTLHTKYTLHGTLVHGTQQTSIMKGYSTIL
jgi:hypothetical protein